LSFHAVMSLTGLWALIRHWDRRPGLLWWGAISVASCYPLALALLWFTGELKIAEASIYAVVFGTFLMLLGYYNLARRETGDQ